MSTEESQGQLLIMSQRYCHLTIPSATVVGQLAHNAARGISSVSTDKRQKSITGINMRRY